MKNVIYKICNIVNGKFYVGSTVDSRKRFWAHRKALRAGTHDCTYLQRAWNKYGEDCFKFEIIEQLGSREELYPAEQRWLDEHFGQAYCYNVAAHADSPMRDASPEMRALLAERTKAWLEREGHPRTGAEHTEQTKKQMSAMRKGKASGIEHYRYGKTVSEEVRKKIGDAQRGKAKAPGRKVSEEGMAKIRAAAEAGHYAHWAGRKHSDSSRDKMGRAVVATDPEGVEHVYATITKLREALGITAPTVDRALKSGKPLTKGKAAGWQFKYLDTL